MDDLADCGACEGMPGEIHISDVIEVIETDPDFNPNPSSSRSNMFNGSENVRRQRPKCIIVEQPAPKALRFRYECEGRSAGSIPGANSTPENKTYPRIQITGYQGRAVVVVSCVTKDPPYRPHPHNLVGRDGCKRGVCTLEVPVDTMTMTFSNLGIQCVKKKDIESALKTREDIRVDPFRTGFSHRNQPTSIDLNAVRLCFQVFLQGETRDKYTDLTPVVSNPIYDKKAMSDLVIVKLSDCVSPVDGGNKDIILLCEKVAKEDIQVRFYEEKDGNVIWEGLGEFQPSQVHKQTAIWFRPPKYRTMDVREPVKVNIQLKRPSDGATSVPLPFQLLPLDAGVKRRGDRIDNDQNIKRIFRDIQEQERQRLQPFPPQMNIPFDGNIKDEPNEPSRSPYGVHLEHLSPSQQFPILTPTPPLAYNTNPFLDPQNPVRVQLPPFDSWNTPSTSFAAQQLQNNLQDVAGAVPPISIPENVMLFNLDSQQTELRQLTLTSDDLGNLTQNLSDNLSLTDILRPDGSTNMTDSVDRLVNCEFDKHCK